MIQEFFSLLDHKFIETSVPYGALIEQRRLIEELQAYPGDWREEGADAGRSIVIKAAPASNYLAWIRAEILEAYARKIQRMVACKILHEGVLLYGSRSLFDQIKSLLRELGVVQKLDDLEKQARASRATAEDYLLHGNAEKIRNEDRILFYSAEESEEFE
jgi:hypothetical protein